MLFFKIIGFDLKEEIYSLVILGKGVIVVYLDNLSVYNYWERIFKVVKVLFNDYDCVIYEGIGYFGVGSVVGFLNVEVVKMLDVFVVMIVEGGIGKIIDCFVMSFCVF